MKQMFFAQKALIVKDNKLLMVRKSKHEYPNPLRWDVPGGRMEHGEEIDDSLAREICEETGIRANIGKPYYLGQWFVTRPPKNKGEEPLEMQIVAVYRACSTSDTALTNKNSTEDEQIELIDWIPLDEILKLDIMPSLIETMKKFIEDMKVEKIEFPMS